MTLWLALALMTAAAIFAVLWPLARREGNARSGSDVAVYRDQLDEIGRDRAAGLIEDREAAAAQVEVSRRLIAAADVQAATPMSSPASATTGRRRAVAVVALVMLPLGAAGLYLALGSPSLPDQPLVPRLAAAHGKQSPDGLIVQVEAHLERNPDDGRGWEVIAPIYLRLGRFEDAVKARRNALRLNGETAEREAALGEALVFAANGVVTAEAKAAFEKAVAGDASHVQARYFLGLAAEQDGNRVQAAATWRALIDAAAPDAPWLDFVRGAIARAEGAAASAGPNSAGRSSGANSAPRSGPSPERSPGPSEEQVAASSDLSTGQRNDMIRGMVERLSERLHRDGSDIEGWLRLVRSYMVLGESDKARSAVADARRALAGDPGKLRRLDELVKGLGLEG
jgi:cytochrome c-type biogenesis protein CcmH